MGLSGGTITAMPSRPMTCSASALSMSPAAARSLAAAWRMGRGAAHFFADAYFNAMTINADSGDPVFPGGLVEVCPDIAGVVGEQHALHQPRCELGAYGVGAIDLQMQIGCLSRCAQNDKTGQQQAADTRRAQ